MKKVYKTLFLILLSGAVVGQARLVLNSNPYIVLNGGTVGTPIHIVLANPAANAITWTGAAQANGGIISEGQHNKMKWNIATTTGTYSVPFTKAAAGPAIPVELDITGAGVGATGNVKFSTYATASWDNSASLPSIVDNMNSNDPDALPSAANNSGKVMDRFWIIEAGDYDADSKPEGDLTLNYVDAEHSAVGNTISETDLKAQRWNDANSNWDDFLPQGTQGNGSYQGEVSAIPVTATDFEAVWVLVDESAPLPIELTVFRGDCENGQRNLYWSTASETNNNFFTIEKSADGAAFIEIGTLASLATSGKSTTTLNYHYIDKNTVLGDYYRLKQTDFDGKFEYSSIIYNKCDDASKLSSVDVYPNPSNTGVVNVLITGYENESVKIAIVNVVGQQVEERNVQLGATTQKETFSMTDQAKGIYYISVITSKETITKKIINQK